VEPKESKTLVSSSYPSLISPFDLNRALTTFNLSASVARQLPSDANLETALNEIIRQVLSSYSDEQLASITPSRSELYRIVRDLVGLGLGSGMNDRYVISPSLSYSLRVLHDNADRIGKGKGGISILSIVKSVLDYGLPN
jgi:hypothetical protein